MTDSSTTRAGMSPALLVLLFVALFGLVALVGFALVNGGQSVTGTPDDDLPAIVFEGQEGSGVTEITPPIQIPDFTLLDQDGNPLSFAAQDTWKVVYFGFTHCPDFCPTTLAEMKQVWQKLGSSTTQVKLMMISVDGERDTPEVLKQFMGRFNPDFIGLTGSAAEIQPAVDAFGAFYEKRETTNAEYYSVDHSVTSFLVSPDSELTTMIDYGTPVDTIVEAIRAKVGQANVG